MSEPDPAQTISAFVDAFIAAWRSRDATALASYFSEDAVYHNGPLPPVHGLDAIVAEIASFMEMGGDVGVDIVRMVADGPTVMVERVDHFTRDGQTASLPMFGVFEIREGRIYAWRDYFDLNQFTSQLSGG